MTKHTKEEMHEHLLEIMSRSAFIHDALDKDPLLLPRYKLMMDLINANVPNPSNILDVGCQDGYFTIKLGEDGHKVVDIDTIPRFIERANKENHLENVKFQCGFIEDYTTDTRFGCVVMGEVLEHVVDVDAVLDSVRRLCAPSCFWVITVPYEPHREPCKFHPTGVLKQVSTHVRVFDPAMLKDHLDRHGQFTITTNEKYHIAYGVVD